MADIVAWVSSFRLGWSLGKWAKKSFEVYVQKKVQGALAIEIPKAFWVGVGVGAIATMLFLSVLIGTQQAT